MATSRPSLASRARYTSPIPPVPSGLTISKEPSFVPTARLTLRPADSDTKGLVDEAKRALSPSPFSRLTPHRAASLLAGVIFVCWNVFSAPARIEHRLLRRRQSHFA